MAQPRVRVDPWLVVGSALLLGGCAAVSPWPTLCAALALAALLWRRLSLLVWLLAVVAASVGAWRAREALDTYEARRIAARDGLARPERCAARATVVASPSVRDGRAALTLDLHDADCAGRSLPRATRARVYGGPDDLARGDVVQVIAQLAPVRLFRNQGLPDPTPYGALRGATVSGSALSVHVEARGRGLGARIDAARAHARRRILATFSPGAAPMARALVLGENDLSDADDAAFKLSGLAHLLAVSGTHLVFAVVSLVHALRAMLVRVERLAARFDVMRLCAAAGAVLALIYADYSGGTGSAWRAAWMLAAGYGVRALGRRPSAVRALGTSLLVAALVDPLAVFDISLLLSAAATTGLLAVGSGWARRLRRTRPALLRYMALSVAATVSSMLLCVPLLVLLGAKLTIAGIFANVIAMPFGEAVALPLCLVHALLEPVPALERGVGLVASGALLVVRQVALGSAAIRFLAFDVAPPGAWHLAVLAVGLSGALLGHVRPAWVLATAVGLGVVETAEVRVHAPHDELGVTALDVGQGDATLIDLPDGSLMLIDGGGYPHGLVDPGQRVILPLLRARRRSRIDVAVLTHTDADHLSGLATALRQVEVGELWDSGHGELKGESARYHAMLRDLRGRNVRVVRPDELCHRPRRFAGATVTVLGPCPGPMADRSPNDNSLVLRIQYGDRIALLVGDAEAAQEARLVSHHARGLGADLLKVGHHGADTSSGVSFLHQVRPSLATISCGVRNRFGHPRPAALARLRAVGALPLRLDRTGSVTWRTDGQRAWVTAFSTPR